MNENLRNDKVDKLIKLTDKIRNEKADKPKDADDEVKFMGGAEATMQAKKILTHESEIGLYEKIENEKPEENGWKPIQIVKANAKLTCQIPAAP